MRLLLISRVVKSTFQAVRLACQVCISQEFLSMLLSQVFMNSWMHGQSPLSAVSNTLSGSTCLFSIILAAV